MVSVLQATASGRLTVVQQPPSADRVPFSTGPFYVTEARKAARRTELGQRLLVKLEEMIQARDVAAVRLVVALEGIGLASLSKKVTVTQLAMQWLDLDTNRRPPGARGLDAQLPADVGLAEGRIGETKDWFRQRGWARRFGRFALVAQRYQVPAGALG